MHKILAVFAFLFLVACEAAPRIVGTANETAVSVEAAAADLATADVVVLGEMHGVRGVHRVHWQLIEAMHSRRPEMVIAMEMFERDVQGILLKYLGGVIDEATFLADARPWPGYDTDYRWVIEFARSNGVVVLAANAPRKLARAVAQGGIEAVAGNPHVARATTAPEDSYWDAFVDAMQGHGNMSGPGSLQRFYAAQCLKDDTMAESIVDYLEEHRGSKPLAVLICGKMHSDYGRGAVARIRSRMPSLDIRVVSCETVDDIGANVYSSQRDIGDYVIVAPDIQPPISLGNPIADEEAADAGGGGRPALGLMPDYDGEEAGVLVGMLRPGGPAEGAGLMVGDLIVELAGLPVEDVESYMDALAELQVGQRVVVKVRRGDGVHEFAVVLTSRTR